MKSLILKDLLNIGHNAKSMFFMLLVFACITIPQGGAETCIVASGILCSMMVITTFSFDEQSKWTKYAMIILDEPINGLDPIGITEFRNLLLMLNRELHVTMILSSHILSELEHIATHYGFLHRGKLIKEVPAVDIPKSAENLEQFYEKMLEDYQWGI